MCSHTLLGTRVRGHRVFTPSKTNPELAESPLSAPSSGCGYMVTPTLAGKLEIQCFMVGHLLCKKVATSIL